MTVKISKNFISANGKRAGITISAGPWIATAPQDMIKIRCKRGIFPKEISSCVKVENASDMRIDYFVGDSIRLLPGDALYEAAKKASGK